MSSAGFTKRRGLRLIVKRGPVTSVRVGNVTTQRIKLELECGHTVVRGASGFRQGTVSALCPTCRKADGEARDRAHNNAQMLHGVTGTVRVTLPIKTTSDNNLREHWASRAKRRKGQRDLVHLALPMHIRACQPVGPYVITLTRIAPRRLDTDNLQGACKAIRDQVAEELQINDGDPAHEWRYEQRKATALDKRLQVGGYGVEVRIERRRFGLLESEVA